MSSEAGPSQIRQEVQQPSAGTSRAASLNANGNAISNATSRVSDVNEIRVQGVKESKMSSVPTIAKNGGVVSKDNNNLKTGNDWTKNGGLMIRGDYELEFRFRVRDLPISHSLLKAYLRAKKSDLLACPMYLFDAGLNIFLSPYRLVEAGSKGIFSTPIYLVDSLLCRFLDISQMVLPCITVPPNMMIAETQRCITDCVCCCPRAIRRMVRS